MKDLIQLTKDRPELFDDESLERVDILAERHAKLKPGGRAAKESDLIGALLIDGYYKMLEIRRAPMSIPTTLQ